MGPSCGAAISEGQGIGAPDPPALEKPATHSTATGLEWCASRETRRPLSGRAPTATRDVLPESWRSRVIRVCPPTPVGSAARASPSPSNRSGTEAARPSRATGRGGLITALMRLGEAGDRDSAAPSPRLRSRLRDLHRTFHVKHHDGGRTPYRRRPTAPDRTCPCGTAKCWSPWASPAPLLTGLAGARAATRYDVELPTRRFTPRVSRGTCHAIRRRYSPTAACTPDTAHAPAPCRASGHVPWCVRSQRARRERTTVRPTSPQPKTEEDPIRGT